MAMVTVDGGGGYWNPHPGDDPMAMVIGELIPRCQRLGLGRAPRRVAVMGISMGGYGALLLAERYPAVFAAVAAVSPAVWTSYPQARQANPGAFASAAAFAADDVITHAAALGRRPVRIASGHDDPFYPGVQALARALPAGAVVAFGPKLELIIVTGKFERRSHLLIGQGPTAVKIIQVLGAILQEDADRLLLGLAQERWINVSAANVGETAHVT